MARLMSLVFIVFLLIPMLAPSLRPADAADRAVALDLPRPRHLRRVMLASGRGSGCPRRCTREYRRPLVGAGDHRRGARETLTNRQSLGYTLAFTLMMGALIGYINSIQQIVFDVFHRPGMIAIVFAAVAGPMAVTSWLNSRLVERIGIAAARPFAGSSCSPSSPRCISALDRIGESLWVFVALQGVNMACFGLASANFGALAMQPMGHVAGTASSVQGTIGTIVGALIGIAIGQSFDGTLLPLETGFVLLGAAALVIVAGDRARPAVPEARTWTSLTTPTAADSCRKLSPAPRPRYRPRRPARPSAPRRPGRYGRGSPARSARRPRDSP